MHIVLKCQYFKFDNLTPRKCLATISKEIIKYTQKYILHKNVHHNVIIIAKNKNQLNEEEQIEKLVLFDEILLS